MTTGAPSSSSSSSSSCVELSKYAKFINFNVNVLTITTTTNSNNKKHLSSKSTAHCLVNAQLVACSLTAWYAGARGTALRKMERRALSPLSIAALQCSDFVRRSKPLLKIEEEKLKYLSVTRLGKQTLNNTQSSDRKA
ncbi:unnamed protein product [Ceratitis capitata]|uniref:(Mediterranean fruit fly) hypothetical protein n=1 Tax=Ceratitis capitata TaxID=7213 RepID=A0A811UM19_CERCA|nr:unnamed protein product [Ceratitis capitata]